MELWILFFAVASAVAVYIWFNFFGGSRQEKPLGHSSSDEGFRSEGVETTSKKHHHKPRRGQASHQHKPVPLPKEAAPTHDRVTKHPLYLNVLKGFSGEVTCVAISPIADHVAVSCTDDIVRVFDLSGSKLTDINPPYVRGHVEGGQLSAIDFSHDGRSVVGAFDSDQRMVVLQIQKDREGKHLSVTYEGKEPLHKNVVRWLVASKGNFVITASVETDTDVKVWSYRGDLLASYNTKQVKNFQLTSSLLDGRFIGCAAWSPGVKLMEIKAKSGDFQKMEKAMDLKSTHGIKAVCLTPDHQRALTVDKAGQITLWNIDVRYHVSEDPKPLKSVQEEDHRFTDYSILVCSADGKQAIGVSRHNVKVIDMSSLEPRHVIEDAHNAAIENVAVAPSGRFFVTGAADRRPRVWTTKVE